MWASSASRHPALILTALFAILWVIARACLQSITIDEADTYLAWIAPSAPSHWEAASNNHVLNSILAKFIVSIFGPSHFTVRFPAMAGAVIYIAAVYWFVGFLALGTPLRWSLLVLMTYNPLVFDYLVAGRGYSLALAFLMCAIGVVAYHQSGDASGRLASPYWACGLCSVAAALSFAASFSFAFVLGALALMIFLWVSRSGRVTNYGRMAAACIAPGFVVTLAISAPAALRMPKSQLWWGASSLGETFRSVIEASLHELNPQIVNPILYPALKYLGPKLPALAGIAFLGTLAFILIDGSYRQDSRSRWLAGLGIVLFTTLVLAISVHWVGSRFFRILLPKDRTAVYLAPLCTALVGIVAAMPPLSRAGAVFRRVLVVTLFITAIYFVGCVRLRYFREWRWDADVNRVYDVLAYYNHTYGLKDVATSWMFAAALNYYRTVSGHETMSEFVSVSPPYAEGKSAYVLNWAFEETFIKEHGLKVVYRGEISDVVVAIRPELEAQCVSACNQ